MTTQKHQAIEIARKFVSNLPAAIYPVKDGCLHVELRDSDAFSKASGVDSPHWTVTFEYAVPDGIVLSPDEVTILVAEASGKPYLATAM